MVQHELLHFLRVVELLYHLFCCLYFYFYYLNYRIQYKDNREDDQEVQQLQENVTIHVEVKQKIYHHNCIETTESENHNSYVGKCGDMCICLLQKVYLINLHTFNQ